VQTAARRCSLGLSLVGCECGDVGYVKKAKYDTLQKQLEETQADLRQHKSKCPMSGFAQIRDLQ